MPPTSWSRRSTAATAAARGVDDHLENGVYSFQYHPELARDPSANDGKGTQDYVRYAINLAERKNFWIASQRELYQRMADYEDLLFQVRDGGREVTVANPTDRRIAAMVVEQRRPFGSVWDGDEELVHVVRDAFVTVPPLSPGGQVTLRFETEETEAPLLRQPSHKGLIVLDARHDPRTGETRVVVSVCRAQRARRRERGPRRRLSGAGGRRAGPRPDAANRAHDPGAPEQAEHGPRDSHPSHQDAGRDDVSRGADRRRRAPIRRAHHPHRAAARPAEAGAARASILAAIPARTGRVI